jgi:hypothetical protein
VDNGFADAIRRTLAAVEVLTWAQLVRRAGSRNRAGRWLAEGLWWRVLRGAYAPVEIPDDLATRAAALRVVLPGSAVVSHRSALWLLGLQVLGDRLDLTVPRGQHLLDRPGVRVSSARLPDDELVRVGETLAVSAARAFVDVAREESLVEAVAVGDAVLRSGAATAAQLDLAVERAAGLRGVVAARAVLPHLEPRSESPMESRFRMRLVLGGVRRPDAQYDVYDAAGHVGRTDLHLDGVVLEYDGREQRLDKRVFVEERRRQTRIAETGLEVRRFTSVDVYVRPAAAVCAEVMRAVAQASGRDRSSLRTGPDTLRPPRLRPLPTLADLARQAAA